MPDTDRPCVFEAVERIEELGAELGDRIVLYPHRAGLWRPLPLPTVLRSGHRLRLLPDSPPIPEPHRRALDPGKKLPSIEVPERADPALAFLRRVLPGGLQRPGHGDPEQWPGSCVCGHAYAAERSIAGTSVKAGDLILLVRSRLRRKRERAAVEGRYTRIPRKDFDALRRGLHSLRFVDGSRDRPERLAEYLAQGHSRRGRDSTSPLLLFRPIRRTISEPIVASSDAAAVFTLIHDAGGTMPTRRGDDAEEA